MRAAGAWIVVAITVLMWWLVTWGGALQAMEWVRRCPLCRSTLRKGSARERFCCNNCGWSE